MAFTIPLKGGVVAVVRAQHSVFGSPLAQENPSRRTRDEDSPNKRCYVVVEKVQIKKKFSSIIDMEGYK